jgi:hypothetical protein
MAPSIIGYSLRSIARSTERGSTTALMPRMSAMLQMFDPMMLPIARASSPAIAEKKLMTNSGIEVPSATTVRPTTIGRRP